MILHRLLLLLNLDWNREVEMTVQDLDFRALPGYFKGYSARDTPETRHNATELDFLAFDDQFTTWKQLYQAIPKDTDTHSYKLLVLARHGEGYHNAAEARYGEKAWNEYWSKLEGDQEWEPVFSTHRPSNATVNVKVIEYLRETLGVHTCDERVSHSQALSEYQDHRYNNSDVTVHFDYPGNYSEKDQLWYPDHRETKAEMDRRTRIGLREMFSSVNTTDKVISLTCHSGVIASVLRNIKHPAIDHLQTGKLVYAVVELSKAPTDDQPMLVVS
ncbi:related to Probable phosphomutase PMU1 [Nakaseomyces glabratus]|nr:related to Probable phosphomutase PMU1 [Nakaseomyces glabratus]SLM16599.1 related to Probable phosphomutase PMU1 [Nakaseomyces glabratus]